MSSSERNTVNESVPEHLEARFIEQEHRLLQVLMNFWTSRKVGTTDRIRAAARHALVWRLIAPSTALGAGVGITAVVGLILAWQANGLFGDQNLLIVRQNLQLEAQNTKIARQNDLIAEQSGLIRTQNLMAEASRRSALVFELTDILNEVDEELDGTGLETIAALSAHLDRDSMVRTQAKEEDDDSRPRHDRRSIGTPRPLFRLSTRLTGRIVALSRALRPYVFLDESGNQMPRPLSPERGQLLLSLVYSGIDMEDLNHEVPWFHDADLRGANLSQVDLTHTKLQGANLRGADLTGATMSYVRLDRADLRGARMSGARGLVISTFVLNGKPLATWNEETRFPDEIDKHLLESGLRVAAGSD